MWWSLRAPSEQALELLEEALGSAYSKVGFINGIQPLYEHIRDYFNH